MKDLNDTHDPDLKSCVVSSNIEGSDFPIQNLPFGICQKEDNKKQPLGCIAIGDQILVLDDCLSMFLLTDKSKLAAEAVAGPTLIPLISL